jgi:hypothetical protein
MFYLPYTFERQEKPDGYKSETAEIRRTRKKSVNPAQREGEGGPAVRGIEFTSNGGGGEALPRRVKRRKPTFYEVIK